MATFLSDSFTLGPGETVGADLAAHTGERGATWSHLAAGTGTFVLSAAGRIRVGGAPGDFGVVQYQASGAPGSADYTVQADLTLQSVPTGQCQVAVSGRMVAGSGQTGYFFGYDATLGWFLLKNVSGVQTTLGSSALTLPAGATHTIALVMTGTQISGVVDGTTVIGPLTDAALGAAGRVGVLVYLEQGSLFSPGEAQGPQLDNLSGQDSTLPVSVAVTPAAPTLLAGAQAQFRATVGGSANQTVTWSVDEGASGGAITAGGLYSAPSDSGVAHVRARAQADGVTSADAPVHVIGPPAPRYASYPEAILAEPSLLAYWRHDDPPGSTTLVDSKGAHHGTVSADVTFGAPALTTADLGGAAQDSAATYGGTGGTSIGASSALAVDFTGDFSVECVLQPTFAGSSVAYYAICGQFATPDVGWELGIEGATPRFTLHGSAGAAVQAGTPGVTPPIALSAPTHLCATYRAAGGAMTVYHNGTAVATATAVPAGTLLTAAPLAIGQRPALPGLQIPAVIGHVALYSSALQSGRVAAHAAAAHGEYLSWPTQPALIVDTDCNTDCGDPGALALAAVLAARGEARLLAALVDVSNPEVPACVNAILTYYRRPLEVVPIGRYAGTVPLIEPTGHAFVSYIAQHFPQAVGPAAQDATALYRQTLAAQPDASVTIVSIGFLRNLMNLLQSTADAASPLDGRDLVAAKVAHLVVMGGQYPASGTPEYNFAGDPAAASYVAAHWPTPVVFSGFEVGNTIIAGGALAAEPTSNPARYAFDADGYLTSGRAAWDQTAVLYATRRCYSAEDGLYYWTLVRGTNSVDASAGSNTFTPGPGPHYYVRTVATDAQIGAAIDGLCALPPPAPARPRARRPAPASRAL